MPTESRDWHGIVTLRWAAAVFDDERRFVEVTLTDGSSETAPDATSTPSESSRTRRLQAVVAVIGLAGILASPILGCLLGAANKENDANRRTIADQQATIDRLRAENGLLQVLAANPVVQADPGPAIGRQLRSGTLTLPFLYCADLDTNAPDWRMTNADCGNGPDVLLGQDFQGLRATAWAELVPSERASFAGCRSEGTYGGAIPYGQLQPKTLICVRTSADNVALLEVVTIDGAPTHPDKITFNVTVWTP
ncbi:hypothetical protein AB0K00_56775 [Dactylosporangium sp. NPDC049525]|uniref:hypothetical protein n=1 Tax=Dactylosporangium sp. NPDC049525 TaxID=3154730 RepID=UPI003421E972